MTAQEKRKEPYTCLECGKTFEPYLIDVCCHVCDGDGYIEEDDDFMRSDFRKCWQCNGAGEYTIRVRDFCDEDCREEHFHDQIDEA